MGCYINPKDMTKEEWLRKHAVAKSTACDFIHAGPDNTLPVCLVDNGAFTAAGIAFNDKEIEAFNHPTNRREKIWLFVPIKDLFEVAPDLKFFIPELAPS